MNCASKASRAALGNYRDPERRRDATDADAIQKAKEVKKTNPESSQEKEERKNCPALAEKLGGEGSP